MSEGEDNFGVTKTEFKRLDYNTIIFFQLDRIGRSSLITEKTITSANDVTSIKPPFQETVRILYLLLHPYLKDKLKDEKGKAIKVDYENEDVKYWAEIMEKVMEQLDSMALLMKHRFEQSSRSGTKKEKKKQK